jgi:hypothetical protein
LMIVTGIAGFAYLLLSMIWWYAMYANAETVGQVNPFN